MEIHYNHVSGLATCCPGLCIRPADADWCDRNSPTTTLYTTLAWQDTTAESVITSPSLTNLTLEIEPTLLFVVLFKYCMNKYSHGSIIVEISVAVVSQERQVVRNRDGSDILVTGLFQRSNLLNDLFLLYRVLVDSSIYYFAAAQYKL